MSVLSPWQDDPRYGVGTQVEQSSNLAGEVTRVRFPDGAVRTWRRERGQRPVETTSESGA